MTPPATTAAPVTSAPRTHAAVGAAVVAVAVIWQGLGTALVSHTITPVLGTFSTFTAFLLAALIGLAAKAVTSARALPETGSAPRMTTGDVLILNGFTAGAFACFYVAATLIPATAASVIETGLGPIAVAVALLGGREHLRTLFHPILVLAAAGAVAISVFAVSAVDPGLEILGILLSVIAGTCAAGVLLISRRLAGRGVSALHIGAARFHLAWILCGGIALPTVVETHQSVDALARAAGISVIGISLPILLLQWGITKASPLASAVIISALPAIVLTADTVLGSPLTPAIALTMSVLVVILVAGLWPGRRAESA